jgi:hypothetical protein
LSFGLSPDEERAVLSGKFESATHEPAQRAGADIRQPDAAPGRQVGEGREKLVAWLKLRENGAAKHSSESSMAGRELSWMWTGLGVADLRR